MPIIKVVPTIPEMRKHTWAASVYVQILRGVEHWILEGATYRHDPQKKRFISCVGHSALK